MIDITRIDIDSIFIPKNFIICQTYEQFEFMCLLGHQLKYKWANGDPFIVDRKLLFKPGYGINIIEGHIGINIIERHISSGDMPFDDIVPLEYFEEWQRKRKERHFESTMKLMQAITGQSYKDLPDFVESILTSKIGI